MHLSKLKRPKLLSIILALTLFVGSTNTAHARSSNWFDRFWSDFSVQYSKWKKRSYRSSEPTVTTPTPAPEPIADTTAPTITTPSNIYLEASMPNGAKSIFNVSAIDDTDGSVTVNCSPASTSIFPVGTTAVNCSAKDSANNTAQRQFNVTVKDSIAPTLLLPNDIILESLDGTAINVDYFTNAVDAVDTNVTPVCFPAASSQFELGETQVQCVATDNFGNTTEGTFLVAVNDVSVVEPEAPTSQSLLISWAIPTMREDGSPMSATEIGGYQIIYSENDQFQPHVSVDIDATNSQQLDNQQLIADIAPGSYHISIATYDTAGKVSSFAEPIVYVVN